MRKVSLFAGMALAVVAAATWVGQALSQEGGEGGRRGGRRRFGGDPRQRQQRMFQMVKQGLGASDEEWQVVQPRLQKLMALNGEANPQGGMRFLFMRMMRERMRERGGQGGDRGRREGGPERQRSEVQKAAEALNETLEKEDAPAEEITAKLTVLREARKKAREALAIARKELRELLTQRQEAFLVLIGQLD